MLQALFQALLQTLFQTLFEALLQTLFEALLELAAENLVFKQTVQNRHFLNLLFGFSLDTS